MMNLIYNIQTGETSYEEVADVEIPIENAVPIEQQISGLKLKLESTDYKIIKCSECQLVGKEMPYDITTLHAERQAIRDNINILEASV